MQSSSQETNHNNLQHPNLQHSNDGSNSTAIRRWSSADTKQRDVAAKAVSNATKNSYPGLLGSRIVLHNERFDAARSSFLGLADAQELLQQDGESRPAHHQKLVLAPLHRRVRSSQCRPLGRAEHRTRTAYNCSTTTANLQGTSSKRLKNCITDSNCSQKDIHVLQKHQRQCRSDMREPWKDTEAGGPRPANASEGPVLQKCLD